MCQPGSWVHTSEGRCVCMWGLCVCMCVHVCACVYMCVHVCACVCMCVCVGGWLCVPGGWFNSEKGVRARLRACMSMWGCVCVGLHVCVLFLLLAFLIVLLLSPPCVCFQVCHFCCVTDECNKATKPADATLYH